MTPCAKDKDAAAHEIPMYDYHLGRCVPTPDYNYTSSSTMVDVLRLYI